MKNVINPQYNGRTVEEVRSFIVSLWMHNSVNLLYRPQGSWEDIFFDIRHELVGFQLRNNNQCSNPYAKLVAHSYMLTSDIVSWEYWTTDMAWEWYDAIFEGNWENFLSCLIPSRNVRRGFDYLWELHVIVFLMDPQRVESNMDKLLQKIHADDIREKAGIMKSTNLQEWVESVKDVVINKVGNIKEDVIATKVKMMIGGIVWGITTDKYVVSGVLVDIDNSRRPDYVDGSILVIGIRQEKDADPIYHCVKANMVFDNIGDCMNEFIKIRSKRMGDSESSMMLPKLHYKLLQGDVVSSTHALIHYVHREMTMLDKKNRHLMFKYPDVDNAHPRSPLFSVYGAAMSRMIPNDYGRHPRMVLDSAVHCMQKVYPNIDAKVIVPLLLSSTILLNKMDDFKTWRPLFEEMCGLALQSIDKGPLPHSIWSLIDQKVPVYLFTTDVHQIVTGVLTMVKLDEATGDIWVGFNADVAFDTVHILAEHVKYGTDRIEVGDIKNNLIIETDDQLGQLMSFLESEYEQFA